MKRSVYLPIIFFIALCISVSKSNAQGCIAIRSAGGMVCDMHQSGDTAAKWLFAVNNRYYNSYEDFIGTTQQKQRQAQGTEVINHGYTMDLSLTRNLNERWSVFMDVPIISNSRSSLYEHTT